MVQLAPPVNAAKKLKLSIELSMCPNPGSITSWRCDSRLAVMCRSWRLRAGTPVSKRCSCHGCTPPSPWCDVQIVWLIPCRGAELSTMCCCILAEAQSRNLHMLAVACHVWRHVSMSAAAPSHAAALAALVSVLLDAAPRRLASPWWKLMLERSMSKRGTQRCE